MGRAREQLRYLSKYVGSTYTVGTVAMADGTYFNYGKCSKVEEGGLDLLLVKRVSSTRIKRQTCRANGVASTMSCKYQHSDLDQSTLNHSDSAYPDGLQH